MGFLHGDRFSLPVITKLSVLLIGYSLGAYASTLPEAGEAILKAGRGTVKAKLARTPETREYGLMGQSQLKADNGMLFVFDVPEAACLWMKDTPIPLSAAFINDAGQIVAIIDLEPNSEQPHCAPESIHYILEVNRDWFNQNGVKPGDKIGGLPLSQ